MTLCLFSVLSKEQGITVLAVCLCYEYFIVNKVCVIINHGDGVTQYILAIMSNNPCSISVHRIHSSHRLSC